MSNISKNNNSNFETSGLLTVSLFRCCGKNAFFTNQCMQTKSPQVFSLHPNLQCLHLRMGEKWQTGANVVRKFVVLITNRLKKRNGTESRTNFHFLLHSLGRVGFNPSPTDVCLTQSKLDHFQPFTSTSILLLLRIRLVKIGKNWNKRKKRTQICQMYLL